VKLALFDIDGTLTDTNRVDGECFVAALREVFGIDSINEDWSQYPHTTDRSILGALLRRAWSREATEEELLAHRQRFVALMTERMARDVEIPGAVDFLARLRREDWTLVLCTGAWSDSARLKLDRAGFPTDLRVSSCDRFPSREEIVQEGIAIAGGEPQRMVIFGDATWDVRTARNLALPFIGVGSGRRAERLRAEGAESVIADYTDASAVLRLMAEARPPR
jgi:phosphoglycolate phosphatase-like HAD superfamily hydrolase